MISKLVGSKVRITLSFYDVMDHSAWLNLQKDVTFYTLTCFSINQIDLAVTCLSNFFLL